MFAAVTCAADANAVHAFSECADPNRDVVEVSHGAARLVALAAHDLVAPAPSIKALREGCALVLEKAVMGGSTKHEFGTVKRENEREQR